MSNPFTYPPNSGAQVWLLLSHTDALDENTNLDKLGRVAVRAVLGDAAAATPQAFRQEMHLANATVHIDLPSGVSFDVWVDATARPEQNPRPALCGAHS